MRNGHLYNFCWVIPCRQICRVNYFAFLNSENFPTQWQNTDNDDEDAERRLGWGENSDVEHSVGVVVLSG